MIRYMVPVYTLAMLIIAAPFLVGYLIPALLNHGGWLYPIVGIVSIPFAGFYVAWSLYIIYQESVTLYKHIKEPTE